MRSILLTILLLPVLLQAQTVVHLSLTERVGEYATSTQKWDPACTICYPGPTSIAQLQGPFLTSISYRQAQLSWKTSMLTTSKIEYRSSGALTMLTVSSTPVTDHVVLLVNLSPSTVYTYTVTNQTVEGANLTATGAFKTR